MKDGNLMPPYQPPKEEEDELDKWRSEGRGCLFF
jgi:hypothetical protein